MNIPNAEIAELHKCYEQTTGIQLPLNRAFNREYAWSCWRKHGWNADDLRCVVAYLRRNFKDHWLKMVRFGRLIEDHAYFEEWLGVARATSRNAVKPLTERQKVLEATGRPCETNNAPVKLAGAIAADILKQGYENMRKATE